LQSRWERVERACRLVSRALATFDGTAKPLVVWPALVLPKNRPPSRAVSHCTPSLLPRCGPMPPSTCHPAVATRLFSCTLSFTLASIAPAPGAYTSLRPAVRHRLVQLGQPCPASTPCHHLFAGIDSPGVMVELSCCPATHAQPPHWETGRAVLVSYPRYRTLRFLPWTAKSGHDGGLRWRRPW
jgi:hypothetical protein